jgi:ATP-dependent protease ClpP protease subunit
MKSLLISLSILVSSTAFAGTFTPKNFAQNVNKDSVAAQSTVLNESNSITLRGPIDAAAASKFVLALGKITADEVTIVINSPGGLVTAGNRIVDAIRASKAKITCIPIIAASMAFVITQACDVRMATSASLLMQHQVSGGMEGPYENMKSQFEFMKALRDESDELQASRIGMTVEAFEKMVLSDVWFTGAKALKANVVDKLGYATCSKESLSQTYTEDVRVFIFTVRITWSKCPMAAEPLGFERAGGGGGSQREYSELYDKAVRLFHPSIEDTKLIKEINK